MRSMAQGRDSNDIAAVCAVYHDGDLLYHRHRFSRSTFTSTPLSDQQSIEPKLFQGSSPVETITLFQGCYSLCLALLLIDNNRDNTPSLSDTSVVYQNTIHHPQLHISEQNDTRHLSTCRRQQDHRSKRCSTHQPTSTCFHQNCAQD